jgi:hypothetical protein
MLLGEARAKRLEAPNPISEPEWQNMSASDRLRVTQVKITPETIYKVLAYKKETMLDKTEDPNIVTAYGILDAYLDQQSKTREVHEVKYHKSSKPLFDLLGIFYDRKLGVEEDIYLAKTPVTYDGKKYQHLIRHKKPAIHDPQYQGKVRVAFQEFKGPGEENPELKSTEDFNASDLDLKFSKKMASIVESPFEKAIHELADTAQSFLKSEGLKDTFREINKLLRQNKAA